MSKNEKPPLSTGKKWLLGGVALLGVVLLLLGSLPSLGVLNQSTPAAKEDAEAPALGDDYAYARALAGEIEQLCAAAIGSNEVYAVVSLEEGYSYTYATDREQRSEEGSAQSSDSYLTVGSGSAEKPVLLSTTPPQIRGLGVVCRGGAVNKNELISLLSAAYDVGSNRIYIILQQ